MNLVDAVDGKTRMRKTTNENIEGSALEFEEVSVKGD